jgi:hypothetical protein
MTRAGISAEMITPYFAYEMLPPQSIRIDGEYGQLANTSGFLTT